MIEVPVRVKDALRSGEYRKNVKITVPGVDMREVVTDVVSGDDLPTMSQIAVKIFDDHSQLIGWDIHAWNSWSFEIDDSYSKIRIYANVAFDYLIFDGTRYDAEGDKTYATIPTPTSGEYEAYDLTFYYISHDPDYKPSIRPQRFDCYKKFDYFDNNNLVAESVKFDERMCSDSNLKFGLCEGTSVEFQYFDLPNIRGEHISISIDIQYKDTDGTLAWYEIPMGQYDVAECSRQASTGIIKATAYNKLQSNYLDSNMYADIYEYVSDGTGSKRKIVDILNFLLDGFHIEKTDWDEVECKLWAESNVSWAITGGIQWYQIYYDDGTGWSKYEKSPWGPEPHEYPYTYPSGHSFVVYAAKFYYIPEDASSESTSHYWKYEDIQIPAIWNIVKENLNYFYDSDGVTTNVYIGHTQEPMFMPWFSVDTRSFSDITATLQTSGYNKQVCGHIGVLNTSVCGYSAPVDIGEFTGNFPVIQVPLAVMVEKDDAPASAYPLVPCDNQWIWAKIMERYEATRQVLATVLKPKLYKKRLSPIEEQEISKSQLDSINGEITLRDIQSAVFEIDCQYGKLDRVTDLFAGIELNNASLYPRDGLYPNNGLYPMGQSESGYPAMYSKLWADEGNVHKFRYLIITYKGTENGQEVEKKLQRTVYADGTDDYNMSDNWLFRNLVWTDVQVGAYADAMVAKMRNISWFPFEMWCAGLPYLESGDAIEIQMREGAYKSYVLRRSLSGIQNLQDEMINGTLDIF